MEALTKKELEVCQALVASPEKLNIVADSIGMNTKTFQHHQHNAYKKLKVSNRQGLLMRLKEIPTIDVNMVDLNPFLRLMNRKLDLLLKISGATLDELQ